MTQAREPETICLPPGRSHKTLTWFAIVPWSTMSIRPQTAIISDMQTNMCHLNKKY